MNLDDLQGKLIAAARVHPPPDSVPAGFERRVMVSLRGLAPVDHLAEWAQALWRAAAPCVALAVFLAAWMFLSGHTVLPSASGDLSQDFENTVLADTSSVEQVPTESLQ